MRPLALFEQSVAYAKEREQFGEPIFNFGAIKHKLAQQAIKLFASESALYRCSSLINDRIVTLKSKGTSSEQAKLLAAEEYAIECSILKIDGSESLDYIVDEMVQIFGGMGYSEEGVPARAFRDARINRIFEGTNEINRLVIMSTSLKKAMRGKIDVMTPALAIQAELMEGNVEGENPDSLYPTEEKAVSDFKKVLLMLLGTAAQQAMGGTLDLKTEQELLMNLSDIIIHIFLAESILLRVSKINAKELDTLVNAEHIMKVAFHDYNSQIYKYGIDAISSLIDSPKRQGDYIFGLRKYTAYPLRNVKDMRRAIANTL